jgi:phenylacetate-CoA ligase
LAEWFSRAIGFPLIIHVWWRRPAVRRQFRALLREKLESQYWPPEQIAAGQLALVKALLAHAGAHVPYYRDLFCRLGFDPRGVSSLADLAALPPLTRQTIQAEGRRLVAENLPDSEIGTAFTGGSTGLPLKFWYDPGFYIHAEAAAWVADIAAGRRFGSRTVYLWGYPRDITPITGWRGLARRLLRNEFHYDTRVLWEERLRAYHALLQQLSPAIVVGMASSTTYLAQYLEREGLEVPPGYPRQALIASGEVLEPQMRAALERVFQVPVFNRYGSREVGLLAYQCDRREGLHLNVSNAYVECAGLDVYRQPGELLITQLRNYAMPLIRYQIDDLAVLEAEPCGCGRTAPMVKRLAGRTPTTFVSAAGVMIEGYHLINALRQVEGILEFQLVQEEVQRLRLHLVTTPAFVKGSIWETEARIAKLMGPETQLAVEHVDRIPRPLSGKTQMVISKVPRPAGGRPAS